MLSVLCSSDVNTRDIFVQILKLERLEDTPIATTYRRGGWIFTFLKSELTADHVEWINTNYIPERIYFPFFGYSIDLTHEVGDVIVANVFFPYNTNLDQLEVNESNRDTIVKDPLFLDYFDEQKDYYVEDFWLSVGGILVHGSPENPNDALMTKMMLAYEADAYITASLTESLVPRETDDASKIVIAGIIRGKTHAEKSHQNPIEFTARNMVTAMKLLQDEEE